MMEIELKQLYVIDTTISSTSTATTIISVIIVQYLYQYQLQQQCGKILITLSTTTVLLQYYTKLGIEPIVIIFLYTIKITITTIKSIKLIIT